jgi:hypothetical protein
MLDCHFLSLQMGKLVHEESLFHVGNRGFYFFVLQPAQNGLFHVLDHYGLLRHLHFGDPALEDVSTRRRLSEAGLKFIVSRVDDAFVLVGLRKGLLIRSKQIWCRHEGLNIWSNKRSSMCV